LCAFAGDRTLIKPKLGPVVYRALDGVSDYAAIITMIEKEGTVHLTTFPPGNPPTFLSRITFDGTADSHCALPGTCFNGRA
jgi:hypothetical protein